MKKVLRSEKGEIIPFPAWILLFHVSETILELLDPMGILLLKKFLDPFPVSEIISPYRETFNK